MSPSLPHVSWGGVAAFNINLVNEGDKTEKKGDSEG